MFGSAHARKRAGHVDNEQAVFVVVAPVAHLEQKVFHRAEVVLRYKAQHVEDRDFGENWNSVQLALNREAN